MPATTSRIVTNEPEGVDRHAMTVIVLGLAVFELREITDRQIVLLRDGVHAGPSPARSRAAERQDASLVVGRP